MNIEELKYQILQQFGFPPTPEQAQALDVFVQFMTDSNPHAVMILRGSAGTGKTSLSGAIVRTLRAVRQKVMLLAPTGRAAKVFSEQRDACLYHSSPHLSRKGVCRSGWTVQPQ